jgi:ribosomal protein S18
MKMNSGKREKQTSSGVIKKRSNWNQSLKPKSNIIQSSIKGKKSLQYVFLLKTFKNIINYKNIKLLRAFLTIYGKIRPRRKTRVSIKHQRALSKSIRKARAFGILPYTIDVKV